MSISTAHGGDHAARGRVRLSDGAELHFIESGRGPALIFMHGGMGDCHSWSRQIDVFAAHFRALAYSRRLHSPNRNEAALHPSIDEEAADLQELQRALDTGPAHLVATSYGALVALRFALNHPQQVRSLALAEPPLHRWACATLRGRRLLRLFMGRSWLPAKCAFDQGNDDEALRLLTHGMWGHDVYDSLPEARRDTALRNVRAMKLLTRRADPFPELARDAVAGLSMPVLLIRGARASALHRRSLDELAAASPQARQCVVENAGHAAPSENPEGFNAAVMSFVRGL